MSSRNPVEHGIPGSLRPGGAPGDGEMKFLVTAKNIATGMLAVDRIERHAALAPVQQRFEALAQGLAQARLAAGEIGVSVDMRHERIAPLAACFTERRRRIGAGIVAQRDAVRSRRPRTDVIEREKHSFLPRSL